MIAITRTITTGIHRGESTHHQDHAIWPVSLRVIKIRVRIPKKGKFTDTDFVSDIIFSLKKGWGEKSPLPIMMHQPSQLRSEEPWSSGSC